MSFAQLAVAVNVIQWRAAARGLPENGLNPGDNMQVILNTDNNFTGSEDLSARVEAEVTTAVDRFDDRITRVEVHLSDENSGKAGADDKRCMMEARIAGLAPVAVTAQAESIDLAVTAAADKLERALESTLGRLDDRQSSPARDARNTAE